MTPEAVLMGHADEDSRAFSAEHNAHKLAAPTGRSTGPTSAHRFTIFRNLAVIAVTAIVALAIGEFADVANPDYPEARALADRIDDAWKAIGDDEIAPDEAAASQGLRAHTFETARGSETIITSGEPTANGLCYALSFGTGFTTAGGTLRAPDPGCTPTLPVLLDTRGSWSDVLPEPRVTPAWFVPALIVLFTVSLFAVTDIAITLLTTRAARRR